MASGAWSRCRMRLSTCCRAATPARWSFPCSFACAVARSRRTAVALAPHNDGRVFDSSHRERMNRNMAL
jgi:hypothetical protein